MVLSFLVSGNTVSASGIHKRRYHLRAVVQSLAFVALVIGYSAVNWWNGGSDEVAARRLTEETGLSALDLRRLEATHTCDDLTKADPEWLCVFYALGVLYMFLALAIVCDEFFVPALEEMSSKRHLNLSMDVAGATLMAAGGSAPELFSSIFGTFRESEIGFGTIIGSAVFNVLFVIAMCAFFAKEVLALTWWPLFRDSTYYTIGLVMLTVFVGVVSPEEIHIWEACVLFGMYIGYVLIMWKNAAIFQRLTGKELVYPDEEDDETERPDPESAVPPEKAVDRPGMERQNSASSITSAVNLPALHQTLMGDQGRWQGTFRAGVLKLMRDPHSWVETGGVGIVAKIAGDASFVFRQIDQNADGHVDKKELKALFVTLECDVSEAELDEVFTSLDLNNDGIISWDEFNKWYISSAELIRSQVKQVFDSLDTDKSGTLDKDEIKALLVQLDPHVTDEDVQEAIETMYKHGSRDEVAFDEFEAWYETSMIFERQRKAAEEEAETAFDSLKPPMGEGLLTWVQYLLVVPLVFLMAFTIPDVRRPGWGKWCYFAFFISIGWIGAFAYFMVLWAEIIGNTIGIPSVIMGLTVLAAGTSVPDMLSSVIVARRGSGDMAVSSSIGSNIFDILVGLPVPWIMYTAWPDTPSTVFIGSDNIWWYIIMLILMLVFVITSVHFQGWKLTKKLGAMMIFFYFVFLVIAIVLELPFETCVDA